MMHLKNFHKGDMAPVFSKIFLIIIFLCAMVFQLNLQADPIDNIILYPVPLNPSRQTLTIDDKTGNYAGKSLLIQLQIYDINGDILFNRNYASFPIYWKGFSSSGKSVTNGVYIIKLTVEQLDTGSINKKIFRILVKK